VNAQPAKFSICDLSRESAINARVFPQVLVITAMLMAAGNAHAQRGPTVSTSSTVVVRVQAPDGGPFDMSADVELSSGSEGTASHQLTRDAGQAEFDNVNAGTYYVVVTAVGYKPAHDSVEVTGFGGSSSVWIRLEAESGVAPSANGPGGHVLAPKAQKVAAKGLEDLRAGKFQEAQKQFEAAYKLAPGDPDVNYLLGYTLLQEKDLEGAQTYLQRATSIEPHHISALVALGQLRLQQGNLSAAMATLEQAVSLDAENWMAYWSLASAYLRDQQYEKARLNADAAIKYGKGAANGAEIIVGESWAASGEKDKAIEALESFLRDAPGNPAAPNAQAMIAKLKAEESSDEVRAVAMASLARPTVSNPRSPSPASGSPTAELIPGLSVAEANLALPNWAPTSVDKIKPAVSPTATCSLSQVLEKTGKGIQAFVTNVGNIDATEDLVHEELDELGKPTAKEKRRYDYMVSATEVRPGHITVDEQRNSIKGSALFPDGIASSGLPTIALVFHPYNRDDYRMTCEGLGDWHGRPAWIVYFRQRDDVPARLSGYGINGVMHSVSLKGRAWITADSYQIAHLETDMVKPMPEIQLMVEHISVDYKPVRFSARREDVWLPANANLYIEFRKHRFHRVDTFTHYRLFSVDSSEKVYEKTEGEPDKGVTVSGHTSR
jgi:tetratricopeptide (TPR) repeat protein